MQNQKNLVTVILGIVLLFGIIFSPLLQAKDFCADMESKTNNGQVMTLGKMCVKGKKSRHEMNQGGRTMIMINRPDKHVAWSLMPQSKQYMEMPINEEEMEGQPENWNQNLKKEGKFLGKETVNGVECNKYELREENEKVTYWISRKDDIPVRILSNEMEVNYKNIRTDSISNSLFEIPNGYHKLSIPNIPGMMRGGSMPVPQAR
jgi:hypothetical protein